MITALTIKDDVPKGTLRKIGACLQRNAPKTEEKTLDGITVRHVLYEKKRKKIPWNKIAKAVGAEQTQLLYSGTERMPYGFKRYRSAAFMHRMAENGALQVLQTLQLEPYRLKIGLYDPAAQHSALLGDLLPYSACIHAVSDNRRFYTDKAEDIMQSSGAYIAVHKSINALADCQIVIAPQKIRVALPLSDGSVLFTGQRPAVEMGGILLDRFRISLPYPYAALKPYPLSDEYFACALYDKEQAFSLGSLIPRSYISCGREMSLSDLCRFIKIQGRKWM